MSLTNTAQEMKKWLTFRLHQISSSCSLSCDPQGDSLPEQCIARQKERTGSLDIMPNTNMFRYRICKKEDNTSGSKISVKGKG